jgi:hypothetical protein
MSWRDGLPDDLGADAAFQAVVAEGSRRLRRRGQVRLGLIGLPLIVALVVAAASLTSTHAGGAARVATGPSDTPSVADEPTAAAIEETTTTTTAIETTTTTPPRTTTTRPAVAAVPTTTTLSSPTAPVVRGVTADFSAGTITVTFDQPVQPGTADLAPMYLVVYGSESSCETPAGNSHEFRSGVGTPTVTLDATSLAAGTTYITIASGFVRGVHGAIDNAPLGCTAIDVSP